MDDPTHVTAAQITRSFGYWQQEALRRPLIVTYHGRARVMLVSVEQYEACASGASAVGALQAMLDNMAEGFLAFDAGLRLQDMNRVAEAFCGAVLQSLSGIHAADLLGGMPDDLLVPALRRVLRSGELVTVETATRPAGRRISARIFPYRGGVACLFANITEAGEAQSNAASRAA